MNVPWLWQSMAWESQNSRNHLTDFRCGGVASGESVAFQVRGEIEECARPAREYINWLPWRDEFRGSCIENYHHLERLAKVMDELLVL